jgi:NUMOD4 motif
MIEEWELIKGLENRYMVPNLGRIKSVI